MNGKNDLESAKGGNTEIKMTEESINHIPFDAENRETSSPSVANIANDFSELKSAHASKKVAMDIQFSRES